MGGPKKSDCRANFREKKKQAAPEGEEQGKKQTGESGGKGPKKGVAVPFF
ncbi:hypothetical protein HMPREF0262_00354 [Clostridium sp. ATCC 29733]|nr:hypothetical protein HMPREF0262_00354 [Clostridium sp. ATCC 29733]